MPSDWKEESLRHKYDPLPEEPRHRKKAKKRHVKSDHKHEYEEVAIYADTYVMHGHKHPNRAQNGADVVRRADVEFLHL